MSILVTESTKVITHRTTAETGTFHTGQGLACGAKMVDAVQALLEAGKAIDGSLG